MVKITLFLMLITVACHAQSSFVQLATNKGNITLLLYDQTPKHRDAFLLSIKNGLFNNAAFNRVIQSFVSQGGELDDTILEREKQHPELPLKRIEAEIIPELFHKKGALGAGRNDNPQKSSYLTQIYLVSGKIFTDQQLDVLEQKKGFKFSSKQRQVYKTVGGIPHLDHDYTVFGEIVEGMAVADAINSAITNKEDLPKIQITFSPRVLSNKESLKFRN
ncbi:cyclophilin family peptidyl-prolyl cis-trans isomerase [Pedobacter sp. CG_S7]|uniref:peptidylprolyl isomerase n=1 Tax=Pedobacter sp. CG_S7 TaxID=3143930 RepID=UPI0033996469